MTRDAEAGYVYEAAQRVACALVEGWEACESAGFAVKPLQMIEMVAAALVRFDGCEDAMRNASEEDAWREAIRTTRLDPRAWGENVALLHADAAEAADTNGDAS